MAGFCKDSSKPLDFVKFQLSNSKFSKEEPFLCFILLARKYLLNKHF
jgi:hypothetical protein